MEGAQLPFIFRKSNKRHIVSVSRPKATLLYRNFSLLNVLRHVHHFTSISIAVIVTAILITLCFRWIAASAALAVSWMAAPIIVVVVVVAVTYKETLRSISEILSILTTTVDIGRCNGDQHKTNKSDRFHCRKHVQRELKVVERTRNKRDRWKKSPEGFK